MFDNSLIPSSEILFSVLKLFVIPVGGGIPAGVMLADAKSVSWPITALLYLISDVLLAIVFEPVLILIAMVCVKVTFLARFGRVLKEATARSVAHFGGAGAGPVSLIMIAFGVDPMTGRASAMAAGHGFIAGWAIAIAGDMLYFGVIALSTLRLNAYIQDSTTTMLIVLAAMLLLPMLVRRIRDRYRAPNLEG